MLNATRYVFVGQGALTERVNASYGSKCGDALHSCPCARVLASAAFTMSGINCQTKLARPALCPLGFLCPPQPLHDQWALPSSGVHTGGRARPAATRRSAATAGAPSLYALERPQLSASTSDTPTACAHVQETAATAVQARISKVRGYTSLTRLSKATVKH
jgi:hypothetical protein